jgi:hypothetical protein
MRETGLSLRRKFLCGLMTIFENRNKISEKKWISIFIGMTDLEKQTLSVFHKTDAVC